ncbi:hypothetical protein ACFWA5_30825 [Streptomyces mirabilis]|uniref:hypothetical protein n=1 Tax=Streptomyces mirabilis TaxID=68239 RepID=UPI0036462829
MPERSEAAEHGHGPMRMYELDVHTPLEHEETSASRRTLPRPVPGSLLRFTGV